MKTPFWAAICLMFTFLAFTACEKSFKYDPEAIPAFEGLDPPAVGEGYQVHVPPFPIPAKYEREIFIRLPIGNTEDIYVNKFDVLCRPGTHHLIAYGFDGEDDPENPDMGVMRDQNLPDGRANFNLTMGSGAMYCGVQEPRFVQELPAGIAIRIPANSSLDMNSHYFNIGDEMIFGEVFLNMETIPESEVVELLEIDAMNNEDELVLPPREATIITYTETFGAPTRIRQMFSHMHKRGYLFQVYKVGGANDGELLYVSNDYQHPPYKFFEPALEFGPGEGMLTKVYYNNETDREITFGVTSEDEMGILFYSEIIE
ncbi:MAG: hypothetical protein AAFR59_01720 [Bacteroidota bacterium]